MHCMYTWGGGGEWMSESGRTGEGGWNGSHNLTCKDVSCKQGCYLILFLLYNSPYDASTQVKVCKDVSPKYTSVSKSNSSAFVFIQ